MEIEGLASLKSDEGALITVYLDPADGPAATVLGELTKPLRAAAEGSGRVAAMSIRADLARLDRLAPRFGAGPAPGWLILLADHAGIEEIHPLPAAPPTTAVVGRRPYLRPLRALPHHLRSLVVVVERPRLSVFASDGELRELASFDVDLGKDNFGGFRGYDEHTASQRSEQESVRIWREGAAAALASHQDTPYDLLVVAGHQHDLNQFVDQLHPYLRRLPLFTRTVDPRTVTAAQLLELVGSVEPEVRRRRDEEALQAVLEGEYDGRAVARGTSEVLQAVNVGAVDLLVVSGPFAKDGVVCTDCGWLDRSGDRCPACGGEVDEVPDVLAPAIETTLLRGGKVSQVAVASPLDAHGVAALLHFDTPA